MIWIRSFDDVGLTDIASVGGKNASLGEMRRALTPLGIRTPDGFATTADAYRAFLRGADLERTVRQALDGRQRPTRPVGPAGPFLDQPHRQWWLPRQPPLPMELI